MLPQSSRTPTASFYTGTMRVPTQSGDIPKKRSCIFCKGAHAPLACEVITEPSKRLEIVRQQNLCYNCLAHHKVSQCSSKHRCRKCSRKHHTSLCTHKSDITPQGNNADQNSDNIPSPNNTTTTTAMTTIATSAATSLHVAGDSVCLLKTAVANVYANDTGIEATILLDEGSQRSFLTEGLARNLRVQTHHTEDICLASFGSPTALVKRLDVATIYLETITGDRLPLSVLIVPTIAAPVQNITHYAIDKLPYLKGLQLAIPMTVGEQFEVTLLIGADHYWQVVEDHIVRGPDPTAMKSRLGYLLSGPLLPPSKQHRKHGATILHVSTEPAQVAELFWTMESTAISSTSVDPDMTEYQRTYITHEADGSYTARFPWKPNHSPLPTNLTLCEGRTRALARRLTASPELLTTYNNILKDQERRGFIEKINSPAVNSYCHYIPHHAVKKESPTTPIRIVYDCSCHQSKTLPSLNDCLQIGHPSFKTYVQLLYDFVSTDSQCLRTSRKHFYMCTYTTTTEISQDSCGSQTRQTQIVSLLFIDSKSCCSELPAPHSF